VIATTADVLQQIATAVFDFNTLMPSMPTNTISNIDSAARCVLIFHNRKSGASNQNDTVADLVRELGKLGMETRVVDDIDQMVTATAQSLAARQLRTVVAAGGDGTVSLLFNKIESVPIAVLPLGTANLLAKYLEIRRDPAEVALMIAEGKYINLDVGRVGNRYFLVVASCGFDAEVVHRIHAGRRGHITYWSYAMPVIRSICGYRFPAMRLFADGIELAPAKWAFVFNVPRYALDLGLIGDAVGSDGALDLCTFQRGGFFNGLYYFFAVLFGFHRRTAGTFIRRFKTLRIDAEQQVPVQLDGDPAGYLPVEIEVLPARLAVIVPKRWLQASGFEDAI
jgi:diacylglycerol kinase family enzyme